MLCCVCMNLAPSAIFHGLWQAIGWLLVLFSLGMVFVFLPVLWLNQRLCLTNLLDIPLFLAYVCLFGFPLVLAAANWYAKKKRGLWFESNTKEILVAILLWALLMIWTLAMFGLNQPLPLPGFDFWLAC